MWNVGWNFRGVGKKAAQVLVKTHYNSAINPYDHFIDRGGFGQAEFERESARRIAVLLDGSDFLHLETEDGVRLHPSLF